MPFNEPHRPRRDSWPPTIVPLPLSSIDENPISFFLTAPEDLDIDDFLFDEELSAGIDPKPEIREISPSSLQRVPRLEEDEDEEWEPPMTLKDFTERQGAVSRLGLGLGITMPEHAAVRGRARDKLTPGRGKGRGRARTLSARRPQSWREPSPEIWRIEEEDEEDEEKEGKVGGTEMGRSVSSPGAVSGGILKPSPRASASASPAGKKRVHWADI